MKKAIKLNIPLVREAYLLDCIAQHQSLPWQSYQLANVEQQQQQLPAVVVLAPPPPQQVEPIPAAASPITMPTTATPILPTDCAICFLDLYKQQGATPALLYTLCCGHVFHLACLVRCLASRCIQKSCCSCFQMISEHDMKQIQMAHAQEKRNQRHVKRSRPSSEKESLLVEPSAKRIKLSTAAATTTTTSISTPITAVVSQLGAMMMRSTMQCNVQFCFAAEKPKAMQPVSLFSSAAKTPFTLMMVPTMVPSQEQWSSQPIATIKHPSSKPYDDNDDDDEWDKFEQCVQRALQLPTQHCQVQPTTITTNPPLQHLDLTDIVILFCASEQ